MIIWYLETVFNCDKDIYVNDFYIFNLHLKMTSGRSKRRGLVFIIKFELVLKIIIIEVLCKCG